MPFGRRKHPGMAKLEKTPESLNAHTLSPFWLKFHESQVVQPDLEKIIPEIEVTSFKAQQIDRLPRDDLLRHDLISGAFWCVPSVDY